MKNTKNKFVHYYAIASEEKGKKTKVFTSKIPISSELAIRHRNSIAKKRGGDQYFGSVLWAIYDVSSGKIFLPEIKNTQKMLENETWGELFAAIKIKIEKDFEGIRPPGAYEDPIPADPIDSFRIKKTSYYKKAWQLLKRMIGSEIIDYPVIEANLSEMPKTKKMVEDELNYNKGFITKGGFGVIPFFLEEKQGKDRLIYTQKTPFILLDISSKGSQSFGMKETQVIDAITTNLIHSRGPIKKINDIDVVLHTIEILIYQGFLFEEICELKLSGARNANDLLFRSNMILEAFKRSASAGHSSFNRFNNYYTFKYDKNFPFFLDNSKILKIVAIDEPKNIVSFQSIMLFPEEIFPRVFDSKGKVIIGEISQKTREFKLNEEPLIAKAFSNKCFSYSKLYAENEIQKNIEGKINSSQDGSRFGKVNLKVSKKTKGEEIFTKSHISSYPSAKNEIEEICSRLNVKFMDMEVISGPFSAIGFQLSAGYLDEERAKDSGLDIPIKIIEGVEVFPPIILLDTKSTPNPVDRNGHIVHEYQHFLNRKLNLTPLEIGYDIKEVSQNKEMMARKYLSDQDEIMAHKSQIRFYLAQGMTTEEILRIFMPQGIKDNDDILLAARYNKYIEMIEDDIKKELDLIEPEIELEEESI